MLRPCALGLALLLGLAALPAQAAINCSATISGISYGSVNPLAGGPVDTSATLSLSCSASAGENGADICLGLTAADPRLLQDGAGNSLTQQLYRDAARILRWGPRASGQSINRSIIFGPTYNESIPIYGRIASVPSTTIPGSYTQTVPASQLVFDTYGFVLLDLGSCTTGPSYSNASGFSASANVIAQCNPSFSADTLDFGTQGLLGSDVDASSVLRPRCSNTTPYQLGLNNGLYAIGSTRRMRSGLSDHVSYELYRDSARSQRWGDTLNIDTVSGTGNGLDQPATVYGRVPSQTTPPAGIYTDTVTVTITY